MKVLYHLLLEKNFPLSLALSVAQSELRQIHWNVDHVDLPHPVQVSHFLVGGYRKGQLFHLHTAVLNCCSCVFCTNA